jgi:hypothetical protein
MLDAAKRFPAKACPDPIRDGHQFAGNYLHEFPWLDAHHRHRDAPPDQQEEGRSLKL